MNELRTRAPWLLIPILTALAVCLGPAGGRAANAAADDLDAPQSAEFWPIWILGLLLAGGSIAVLTVRRRGVGPSPGPDGALLALRQTVRLAHGQHLHVVEFDGRVLLLGATGSTLTVLTARDHDASATERTIAPRRPESAGVDLSDTPRTDRPATPPTAQKTGNRRADVAAANVADFKSLLRRARKRAGV